MCKECGRFICPSGCPNAPEPAKFDKCMGCGRDILDGEDYYDIDGEPWCEDCIFEARKTAEVE